MSAGSPPRDPEELEAVGAPARAELPAATTVGAVHLTVADLDRSRKRLSSASASACALSITHRSGSRAAVAGVGVKRQRPATRAGK